LNDLNPRLPWAWSKNAEHINPVVRACSALRTERCVWPQGQLMAGFMFRHRERNIMQLQVKTHSATSSPIKEFELFMSGHGHGWTLINKQTNLLDYQKAISYRRGSCLVAFLLFCLGIIPGIIYMFYGRKDAVTHQIIVRMDEEGGLSASGDQEGMGMYSKFVSRNQPSTLSQVVAKVIPNKIK
jgi:hypothetical protein